VDGIIWNESELYVLLESPQGATGRDLMSRAIRVHSAAVSRCAVDTGRLRSSITWEVVSEGGELSAKVGTNVEYGPFVELGTRYMRAQPYLVPALSAA
jgi:phage gpG-like protein